MFPSDANTKTPQFLRLYDVPYNLFGASLRDYPFRSDG